MTTKPRIVKLANGDFEVYIDEKGHEQDGELAFVVHASCAIDPKKFTGRELFMIGSSKYHKTVDKKDTVEVFAILSDTKKVLLTVYDKKADVYHVY